MADLKELRVYQHGPDPLVEFSLQTMKNFFGTRGLHIEIERTDLPAEELHDFFAPKTSTVVRLGLDASEPWLKKSPLLPLKVRQLFAADVFSNLHGRWEPNLLLEEGMRDAILHHAKGLDTKGAAYIIGNGAQMRVLASVALSLGFQRLYLVSENDEDLEIQKAQLARMYMGSNLTTLPADSLTLQTIEASLLMNSLDLSQLPDVAGDLSYFNFMRQGGLVMDLNVWPIENPVLEEASRAGLRVVSPLDLHAQMETAFLDSLGLRSFMEGTDYAGYWKESFQSRAENLTSV